MPSLRELEPWLQPYAQYLVDVGNSQGWRISLNSVYRSFAAQQTLYARYLRGQSAYPVAPPGRSLHQYRVAFDLNVRQGSSSPEQAALGDLWNRMGGSWSPKDPVHFAIR